MELVCAVLRTAGDAFLLSDRATMLSMARSFGLAYTVAIPVLYRTLTVDKNNQSKLSKMFGEAQILSNAGGLFAIPSAQRLWRHVRRLFVEPAVHFPDMYLRHFINLQALYTFRPLTAARCGHLPTSSSLTHIYTLAAVVSPYSPQSTTHVSFYVGFHGQMGFQDIQALVNNSTTITHLAIELGAPLSREREKPLRDFLEAITLRPSVELVAFRIYNEAVKDVHTVGMVRSAARAIHDPTHRVRLWLDRRLIEDIRDDINASKEDAITGRTTWSEAE